jgi:hypothetical protein
LAAVGVVHRLIGFLVVGLFTIGWVWGGWAFLRKRAPGDRFWGWLAVAQGVAGAQALAGIVLFAMGRRPTGLHYVYGFGPLAVLVVAHLVAREGQRERAGAGLIEPWAVFAMASFVCFGLSLRALMTGMGLG